MGDFNDDGFADVAIGAPNEKLPNAGGVTALAGAVNVLYGSASGLTATGNQFWHGASPGIDLVVLSGDTTGDKFGASLAVGDFNNDDFADLAIGISDSTNVGARLIIMARRGSLQYRPADLGRNHRCSDSATAGIGGPAPAAGVRLQRLGWLAVAAVRTRAARTLGR
jgi:hypothetical protein